MSTATGWNGFITTLRTGRRVLLALTLAVVTGLVLRGSERGFASTAVVGTDRTGYLAGQTVTVQGTGFAAGDTVTIKITHAGTPAEGDPAPWVVTADELGAFTLPTGWAIEPNDSSGNALVVAALGTSGATAAVFAASRWPN
jgi:hypothetical protein